MASTQTPPTSIDPRRLQNSASTHTTFEDPDSYNDSIDQSFLASYQSMKNSSSSSPSAMDASDDYTSGTYGFGEHTDFPILGDDFMDRALESFQQSHQGSNGVIPSIETSMDLPHVAISPHNGSALLSPFHTATTRQSGGHTNRFISPHPASPSRSSMRPRTPQINVSTDLGHLQSAQDIKASSFQPGRKDSTPINATPSPSVVVGMWNSDTIQEIHTPMNPAIDPQDHGYFPSQHSSSTAIPTLKSAPIMGNHFGEKWGDEPSGREGIDPDRWQALSAEEVPNFRDQRDAAEKEASLNVVRSWMAHGEEPQPPVDTAAGIDDELHNLARSRRSSHASRSPRTPSHASTESLHNVSESQASIDPDLITTKNQIKEGQVYINRKATTVDARDIELLELQTGLMRLENDGPVSLDIVDPGHHGTTANEAIVHFNKKADNFSLLSRRATWGTQRQSTSGTDIEADRRGGLLKRLSFGKGAEKKPGFINSVVALARKNSSANKLKRHRSDGANPSSPLALEERTSATSLVPPTTPSGSRRRSRSPNLVPRIETNIGDLLMPGSHSQHGRRQSTSNASPTSSIGDFIDKHIRSRSRSKSDVNRGKNLVEQWKREGGPPIAIPSPYDDEKSDFTPQNRYGDAEDDDGDEEVFRHDENLAPVAHLEIEPTMDGFKQNILVLNPTIKPYLVPRLAHQQSVRYKALLQKRVSHDRLQIGLCKSGELCEKLGGRPLYMPPKSKGRNPRVAQAIDESSDSNPDNKLGPETFPAGIPMPPTSRFPAEFECPYCFITKQFQKPSDWTKHIQEDIAPFTCTFEGCKDAKSFKRKADYVRHENEKHRHIESWKCNIDDCSHICHRKDNFQAHLVREHRMPEPKARTKADILKATGYDARFWQIVDSCYLKSSAEATNAPCKFCGKSFSTFKKLSGHEAKHMEQISLPIIHLVETRSIDTNTIISPVGPPPTSQQPETPGGMTSHASPYSQAYSGSHMSPGGSEYDQYPDPSPTNMQGFGLGHNRSQSAYPMTNQIPNYGMVGTVAEQQQGVYISAGSAPVPNQNTYGSVSPAQRQAHSFGEISPLAQQLNQFGMGNLFNNYGHDASTSMSRSYQSSMADASSPANFPVTSGPFGDFVGATTSMPMTTTSYPATYGMPTTAPQSQLGPHSSNLFGEIDPTLVAIEQGYSSLGQQVNFGQQHAADTGMRRNRSDSNMTQGLHQQYGRRQQFQQEHFHQQQSLAQQQLQGDASFDQWQQTLHSGLVTQSRPRSASGDRAPGMTRGMAHYSYKMN